MNSRVLHKGKTVMGKKAKVTRKKGIRWGDEFVGSEANFNCTKLSMVIEFEPSDKLKRAMKRKKVRDYYFPTVKGKSNV